jgi:short subunit fatty acids transporter
MVFAVWYLGGNPHDSNSLIRRLFPDDFIFVVFVLFVSFVFNRLMLIAIFWLANVPISGAVDN